VPRKTKPKKLRSVKAPKSYGSLSDYKTGEYIRPATRQEASASKAAGQTGAFICGHRVCFVS